MHPVESVTPIGDRRSRSRTRGAEVAKLIENEVVAAGWPVGEGLGSEATLMKRFGVGRSVIREAVRILESRNVARPRPGPGGGLVVTAPERSAVLDHAALYLEYVGFSGMDMIDMMELLQTSAVSRLTEIIDTAGVKRLRALLAGESDVEDLRDLEIAIDTEIARLTGNAVLELFVQIAYNVGRTHGVRPDANGKRWLHERNVELVEAITAGDALAATRIVRRKMRGLRDRQSVLPDRTRS